MFRDRVMFGTNWNPNESTRDHIYLRMIPKAKYLVNFSLFVQARIVNYLTRKLQKM